MLRVILVDDELLALREIEKTLLEFKEIEIVKSFSNVNELLREVDELDFQVAFLDIEMPVLNGIELVKVLKDRGKVFHVVFITAHRNYALEAFELDSLDYLLKPVSKSRLAITINRILERYKTLELSAEESQSESFKVQCFGMFNVYIHDELVHWKTAKTRELFAYLFHHLHKPIHRDIIIEELWGENDYLKAKIKLHTTVSYLRKTFASFGYDNIIRYNSECYMLHLDKYQCDATDMELFLEDYQTITEEDIQEIESIIESYSGLYMENDDYLWSMEKSQCLHNQFIHLLKCYGDYFVSKGLTKKTEKIFRLLLHHAPYEEKYVQLLMQFYIETGNRVAAIEVYQRFTYYLSEELDLLPSPETESIYKDIIHKTANSLREM